ncbi:MAG: hypothetical protein CMP61_12655 [Flavobacteriales bacterium]|nr:hypothetical protein [Flavobacteriales bacterium]
MRKLFFYILFFFHLTLISQIRVSGTVTDAQSGEAILFASVFCQELGIGTVTNDYGYFNLELPLDSAYVTINYLGYKPKTFLVTTDNVSDLDFSIEKEPNELEAVTIKIDRTPQEEIHNSTQMSTVKIPIEDIKYIPSIGGESDVIKVIQLLPGVQKGGEGGTGLYIRGGDVDQNLVLLDEAPVYNIGHLFGFFSVFNQDAIKDMTLYKGAFPSKYGGRLSSILDIRMNDGNMQKFHCRGGVGLLSSRLMVEGPIWKDKGSFMVAGRRTYIDQIFKWVGSFLPYYFYDLNAKLNYKINDKNHFYITSYSGDDLLSFDQRDVEEESPFNFGFSLGNLTATARWNRIVNERLFANYSFIYTNFDYNITGRFDENSLRISSAINDYGLKVDYELFKNHNHMFKYGGMAIFHQFRPNIVNTQGEFTEFLESDKGEPLGTLESGVYFQHTYKKDSSKWEFRNGLRFSGANVKNKNYGGIEPRFSAKFVVDSNSNLKFSYSLMRQYMHLVSSSTVALPTDLWYPVTSTVKPQTSHQFASGYSYFINRFKTHVSLETYYKYMSNLTEYREGANLLLNDDFESELLQGNGESYGVEALIKRDHGRWNGWIGYTLSWSRRFFEELNGGDPYWAKYDRRHNVSVVQNFKISSNWHFGAVWVYSSGSRFTPQTGLYAMPNASLTGIDWIPVYTKRNAVSMSPSHRLDINLVWKSKETRRFKGEWHFGAYNLYNRATPWRIEVVPDENGGFKYIQPGLFGFIPSVAYNFEF